MKCFYPALKKKSFDASSLTSTPKGQRMPLEIGLWRIDQTPVKVTSTSIDLESRLEDLIEQDPTILSEPVMLIGRQVPTAFGKFIDLLGVDADGNVHVLELKRDKTPREVVAQILDYGSWAEGLTGEAVKDLYANYSNASGPFDDAFAERFGQAPPDELNVKHKLTVVASEIDPATERIITYLSRFDVPINVVMFRHFTSDGRSYLARTWLIDEVTAATPGKTPGKTPPTKTWNGQDWFVSFGEEDRGRSWEDARTLGFVSAGGGKWYSRTLKLLPVGGRVSVYIPKAGYVGVGTVASEAVPFSEALIKVDGRPERLADRPDLRGRYAHGGPDDGTDRREYVVRVDWEKTVPRENGLKETGLFANQNSACRLRDQVTIDAVSRHFVPEQE